MTSEERIFEMVKDVMDELWSWYYLQNGNAECELQYDNSVYITVEGENNTMVEIYYGDISKFEDMTNEEIKEYLEDCMKEKFYDFDSEEEFECLGSDDVSIYKYMQEDEKEFNKIAWMIDCKQRGVEIETTQFESALVDELARLGKLMSEEYNPNLVQSYAVDISRIIHANELYEYMKEKNIDMTNVQFYDVNFFHILETDWQINAYWVEGKKDKAVEKFQTHVY